jgi:DNA primase large subunit
MRPFSWRTGTNRFSSEVIDCIAVPVLTDFVAGMYAVADIDLNENFQDAWETLHDNGFFTREAFVEENDDYYSSGELESHFSAAVLIINFEARNMTDEQWDDFLAKHYEAVREYFPKYITGS